jgi:hypothetical protein
MNAQQYDDMTFDDYDRRMAEVEALAEMCDERAEQIASDPDALLDAMVDIEWDQLPIGASYVIWEISKLLARANDDPALYGLRDIRERIVEAIADREVDRWTRR